MENSIPVLLLFLSVYISAVSQLLLKKSAMEIHSSVIFEFVNFKVIFAYSLFFSAVCIDLFALKYVPMSFIPVIETSSYIFVIMMSRFILKEQLSRAQIIAMICILLGILVYVWN